MKETDKCEVVLNLCIQGGIPTIKGTRWPVRSIVELVESDGVDSTLENFDTLTPEMVRIAMEYRDRNPEVMGYDEDD